MYVVLSALCVLPLMIVVQITRLHWQEGSALRQQGENQASSFQRIPASRGAILDRAGRVLAVNVARYDLAVDPSTPGFDEAASTFFNNLSALTGRPASQYRQRVRERASPQFVSLVRGLSAAQKETVDEWEIPGLILEPRFARRYNYSKIGGHVLGHVNTDLEGIAGLELQYDEYLRGKEGRRAVKRDRRGYIKALVGGSVIDPQHGQNIVLSIDLIRQTILEEELARGVAETRATWGTAIAMDPHTGEILALANVPHYDPNTPAAFPENARRNRAITDRIEPGSTFKLVTAVAAVERGIIAPEDTVDTGQGWAVFRGRTMRDVHAYGRVSFEQVIAKSSNVGVARTAIQIDPGVFYQYARNLGFGQNTWVDLPGEVAGSLKKPSDWSGVTHPWMSIGYEIETTALQLLTAYCALANGGLLVQPYVVTERRDMSGRTIWAARQDSIRRAFRPETARRLLPIFEEVVENGTGTHARIEGLRIAGKTGTAQKASGGSYDRSSHRASFIGLFPVEEPSVAMIIVLDEPRSGMYGGAVAAPIFQRIAARWVGTFPAIANLMAPVAPFPARNERVVPDLIGRPAAAAASLVQAEGFTPHLSRSVAADQLVSSQFPEPGSTMRPGGRIRLEVAADTNNVMPDLTGLSARHAVAWLSSRGIEAEVNGVGTVSRQSPSAGSPLSSMAVLNCQ